MPVKYKPMHIPVTPERVAKFWSCVNKTNTCWLWTASGHPLGYGQFRTDGRARAAHVIAYCLVKGPIPEGLELDHLCRTPACVNPEHLEPVTHEENCRRGMQGHAKRELTSCPQGHPYNEANTMRYRGSRYCRICSSYHKKAYKIRKKEKHAHSPAGNATVP